MSFYYFRLTHSTSRFENPMADACLPALKNIPQLSLTKYFKSSKNSHYSLVNKNVIIFQESLI